MYFDGWLDINDLGRVAADAQAAEAVGFDALWTSEIAHDPYLPLALAAAATTRVGLGTAIALAFTRSPTTTAHTAWDLARLSNGRFILGLGTQVQAHIERRFGLPWAAPAPRLRDYIAAMRAVWASWQTGDRLRHTGEFYRLTLMTPFFNPGPIAHPDVPVFIAGVNQQLCRLAGEGCQGFAVHPFHTARYLQEAILPWINEGLVSAGRTRAAIQISATVFAVTGATGAERAKMRAAVRQQIAFYASTPTYRTLLDLHGWGAIGEQLGPMALRGQWAEMAALISDEMLAAFAVEGETLADAARQVRARYHGLLDRAGFYRPFVPGERDAEWQAAGSVFHAP
jgi:probable F420-dependent oxidoreductase